MKKLFLLLPAILVLTACESLGSIGSLLQEPKLAFNSVDIAGISFDGVDLLARVNVENPNAFPIPLPKVDWELFINEASFVTGELENSENIKGGGTTTMDVPLRLTYDGLLNTFTSLLNTREAAYNMAVGLTFPLPVLGDKVYKLDFAGLLPIPQLPKLSAGSMDISKIDHSGLALACTVNVENPNAFPIPFPDMDLDYGVNGVSVLKGTDKNRAGQIAAGAVSPATVNLNVSYADIFKAVTSVKNAKQAAASLSLSALSPVPALSGLADSLDISGVIPILQMPEISFQGITKKSLGMTMEFFLNFEVDNKNSFPYDIGDFLYNFNVNGNSWAQGTVENPPVVKAGSKTVIPLTARISAASMVRDLVNIINSGSQVTYDCTGSMSLLGGLAGTVEKLNLPLNFRGNTRIR